MEARTCTCVQRQTQRHSHGRVLSPGFLPLSFKWDSFLFGFLCLHLCRLVQPRRPPSVWYAHHQSAACPNARSCGGLGGPKVDTCVRCGAGQTAFHLLLCFMWPGAVRRGIQTRTTNGSDAQPGDIKLARAVPVLGSYLFKVLLFGSSCSPTSVFHVCVSNHWY